ncbi:MAG: hypothetical protein LWY06_14125 [Firmicutes bacterium]|nr:hypothetical protein [Bacillota bacterium]
MENNPDLKAKKMGFPILAIVIFLCIAVSAAIFFYVRYWRVPVNEKEAERYRISGKDLYDKILTAPSEENGWPLYVKAYKSLDLKSIKGNTPSQTIKTWVFRGIDSKEKKLVAEIIEKNKEAVKLAKEAAKKKIIAIGFELPGKQLSASQLQVVSDNIKTIGILPGVLILAGDKEVEKGNNHEAAEIYLSALSICRGFDPEGWGISFRVPITAIINNRLGILLFKLPDNDPVVKYILDELNRIQADIPDLKASLYLNNYLSRECLKNMIQSQAAQIGKVPSDLIVDRELKSLDAAYLKLLEYADKLGYESMKDLDKIKAEDKSLIAGSIMIDSDVRYFKMYQVKKVFINGLTIAAALKKYCGDKGGFPDKLEQLTPDYLSKIPEDPFGIDGKFTYIKNGKTDALLYSFGPDLLDNKGKECSQSSFRTSLKSMDGDLVFLKVKQQTR